MIPINYMDEFIKYHAQLYFQNPKLPIKDGTIYDSLQNYGLTTEEITNPNIKNQLLHLEDYYSNATHLQVFQSPNQVRFLQFRHWPHKFGEVKAAKLYLTFPKEQIYQAARIIFDFMEQNKINSQSKVADIIRSDVIVLRIEEKDVEKVTSFVNNQPILKYLARKTNPFSLKEGIVGLAYDDRLSYNFTVSLYLRDYFSYLRENNKLNEASIQGFSQYLIKEYQNIFINKSKLKEFVDKNEIYDENRFYSIGAAINNYEQVTRLIIDTITGKLDFQKYKQFIQECNNKQLQTTNIHQYNMFYNFSNENQLQDNNEKKELLDSYIKYAFKKYGSILFVSSFLKTFLNGKDEGITRDNDYRKKFCSIDKNDFKRIIGDNPLEYIKQIVVEHELQNSTIKMQYQIFIEAIRTTHKKYGRNQTLRALKELRLGNYEYLTNDNNCRIKAKQYVSYRNTDRFCMIYLIEKGYDIKDLQEEKIDFIFANELDNELQKKL